MYNGFTKSDYVFARLVVRYYLNGSPCSFANTFDFDVSLTVCCEYHGSYFNCFLERDEGFRVAIVGLATA